MRSSPHTKPLDWTHTPLKLMAAWPANQPLMMLHSGREHPIWARQSILASPVARYQFDGRSRWIGSVPAELCDVVFTHDPLTDVEAILNATRVKLDQNPSGGFFCGGWIGYFSYDLGRVIEPRAQTQNGAIDDRNWPLIDLAWCPSALTFDHINKTWASIDHNELDNPTHSDLIAARSDCRDLVDDLASADSHIGIGPMHPDLSADRYMQMVQQTIDYIAAGDIFQANIAQRFTASFEGSARGLCRKLFARAQPWYGAYLELPNSQQNRCILSLSPELFLQFDPHTRLVRTRPIKGTRPAAMQSQSLARSPKDAAELHMIVDLMRNDLGRVCEFGSVDVVNPRSIESHPTVHHGVGEVSGRLRADASFTDLLRATFPGGSVTGAPKIRAMQIIDELEPVRRGPYCGAIGFISDSGAVSLNIAIRTLLLNAHHSSDRCTAMPGSMDYFAGAGIVADSLPAAEYQETLDKTAVLYRAKAQRKKPRRLRVRDGA